MNYEVSLLKELAKNYHVTYLDIAEKSNLSISTIKKVFSGFIESPRLDTINAIRAAINHIINKNSPILEEDPHHFIKTCLRNTYSMSDKKIDSILNYIRFLSQDEEL